MNKRYTLIIPFNAESEAKVDELKNKAKKELGLHQINKVPLFVENRGNVDALPSHITLYVWNDCEGLIPKLEEIIRNFSQIIIPIVGVGCSTNDKMSANILFLEPDSKKLYEMNKSLHGVHSSTYKTPEEWEPHCSIMIDENPDVIKQVEKVISTNFKPFSIIADKLLLCEIYPMKLVKTFHLKK